MVAAWLDESSAGSLVAMETVLELVALVIEVGVSTQLSLNPVFAVYPPSRDRHLLKNDRYRIACGHPASIYCLHSYLEWVGHL